MLMLLPGGISISTVFTSLGVYYPNKVQTQQIGIVPDVKVTQTWKDLKTAEMKC